MRKKLERSITQARRDALVFAVLTVLLTPFLLVGAAFGLIFALAGAGGRHYRFDAIDALAYGGVPTFVLVLDALVAVVVVLSILDRRGGRSARPLELAGALGVMAALVVFSLSVAPAGIAFWGVYGALGVIALGLAGRIYEPRDDYYLGWCDGLLDDPFTFRDDWDRAHLDAGFAVAIPRFIVDAYAALFESLWLLRVPRGEVAAAVGLMQAIAVEDGDLLRERLDAAGPAGPPALRLLHRLELVQVGKLRPHLTGRGRQLVRG